VLLGGGRRIAICKEDDLAGDSECRPEGDMPGGVYGIDFSREQFCGPLATQDGRAGTDSGRQDRMMKMATVGEALQ
jgi:hypothetical protein